MSHILLDTNVLTELMRTIPSAKVMEWFARQQGATYYVSAITRAEILLSISLLPVGRRRNNFLTAVEQMFDEDFDGNSLAFDDNCATEFAFIVAERNRCAHPISTESAQIASIALRHNLQLATRNCMDYEEIDRLVLLNPWE